MRGRAVVWAAGMVLIVTGALILPVLAQDQGREANVELELLAAFNEWRLEQDLWLLRRNATLDGLANLQAQYVASMADPPGGVEIHRGRQGEGPRDRALWGPFNWPTYGRTDRMALEEIAYAGRSIENAIDFWMHSEVHRTASLNPAYREIGAAVAPHAMGHIYVLELAGRPNVLPVAVDPIAGLLYLSNEVYWGAAGGAWIGEANEVRLLDARGHPFTSDWQRWQPTLPIPDTDDDTLYVEYSDGDTQVITVVRLPGRDRQDVALLPGLLATPTPPPPTDTPTPGPSPTPMPTILLVYNARSLTLINISSGPLDLGGLEFTDGVMSLAVERWQDRMETSASVYYFPPGDCLQAWLYTGREQRKPQGCDVRHAWVGVQPEELPWTEHDFEVLRGGLVVATCGVDAGQCAFYLP